MAAPAYIDKASSQSASDGSGGVGCSVNIAYSDLTIQPGDLLLLVIIGKYTPGALGGGSVNVTSGGWSSAAAGSGTTYTDSSPASAGNGAVYYRYADGTEAGNVTCTSFSSAPNEILANIYQYRTAGFDMTLRESGTSVQSSSGQATVTWNSIAVGGAERTLLAVSGSRDSSPGNPSGYSTVDSDSGGGMTIKIASIENVSSDGLVTAGSGSSSGWFTAHISLYGADEVPAGGGARSFIVNCW
jgi:hypothetical protein